MNRISRIILGIIIVLIGIGALQKYNSISFPSFSNIQLPQLNTNVEHQNVVYEESVITDVVEKSLPSVVTVGVTTTNEQSNTQDPFDPFGGFKRIPTQDPQTNQNIGSGFIVSTDGLII